MLAKRKPTEADKAALWDRCQICHVPSPFVFSWGSVATCIPCYELNKQRARQAARGAA